MLKMQLVTWMVNITGELSFHITLEVIVIVVVMIMIMVATVLIRSVISVVSLVLL